MVINPTDHFEFQRQHLFYEAFSMGSEPSVTTPCRDAIFTGRISSFLRHEAYDRGKNIYLFIIVTI